MRTLILCVGNAWRNDDGVGPLVGARLRGRLPAGVDLVELPGEGSELIEAWRGYDRVIVIDAARSGAAPGTAHRLDASAQPFPRQFFNYSTHLFGVAEAVETARALGDLPPVVIAHAVEGADFAFGQTLSPAVAQAVDGVVEAVLAELTSGWCR